MVFFQKILLALLVIAITLPMLFLLVIAFGDITVVMNGSNGNGPSLLQMISFSIFILWLLDLLMILLLLAVKEIACADLLARLFSENKKIDDEIMDEERFQN